MTDPTTTTPVGFRCPADLLERIDHLADMDMRKRSSMIVKLLQAAVDAGVKTVNGPTPKRRPA